MFRDRYSEAMIILLYIFRYFNNKIIFLEILCYISTCKKLKGFRKQLANKLIKI